MKLAVIVNEDFRKALMKLSKQSIPLKTSFKLKGVVKKVDEEFQKYEECRQSALNKFGKKDEEGKLVLDDKSNATFDQEGLHSFIKELQDLTQVDIEVNKIKVSDLGDKVEMSTEELFILEQLLEE